LATKVESCEVQVEVLRERLEQVEAVSRVDFSASYNYQDPEEERRKEEQQRQLLSLNSR
jgi:hypothetical protein